MSDGEEDNLKLGDHSDGEPAIGEGIDVPTSAAKPNQQQQQPATTTTPTPAPPASEVKDDAANDSAVPLNDMMRNTFEGLGGIVPGIETAALHAMATGGLNLSSMPTAQQFYKNLHKSAATATTATPAAAKEPEPEKAKHELPRAVIEEMLSSAAAAAPKIYIDLANDSDDLLNYTPLMLAVNAGNTYAVAALLNHDGGANINHIADDRFTAFAVAVYRLVHPTGGIGGDYPRWQKLDTHDAPAYAFAEIAGMLVAEQGLDTDLAVLATCEWEVHVFVFLCFPSFA